MRHRGRPWIAVALLALAAGCKSGGSGDAASAVINTTIAVAASGVSRSQGGCYASCPPGTSCDPSTGYCVSLPCRGQCKAHEQCVEDGLKSRCVAIALPGGNVTVEPSKEAKIEP
jgi:hypothetical protein